MEQDVDLGISEDAAALELEALLGDDLETLEPLDPSKKPEPKAEKPDDAPSEDDDGEADGEESEDDADEDDATDGDDADPDAEEDTDSEADSGIDDETLVDIQIGDDVYEVNFAELRAGYLRNEDYANKVQAFEVEYDSKLQALEVREAELAEELRLASVMATGDLARYDSINWAALKETDPEKYRELKLEAMEAREQAAAVEARRQGINKLHAKAQELRHNAYVKNQQELAEKLVPGYREPEFLKALLAYGKGIGFTEEDISGMTDARHLLLLNNSRLYAESVVRKKDAMDKKVVSKELPPVLKPGVPKEKTSTDRMAVKQARARNNREQSIESAAALLMTLDL